MNIKVSLIAAVLGLSATSSAFANTVCTSKPNPTGGTVSITLGQNEEGQPTISLYAQGGMAHFVSSEGPFVATAQHEPDGSFYTFEDSFGQKGTIAIITNAFGGQLETTASTDFGMWKDASMLCK